MAGYRYLGGMNLSKLMAGVFTFASSISLLTLIDLTRRLPRQIETIGMAEMLHSEPMQQALHEYWKVSLGILGCNLLMVGAFACFYITGKRMQNR